MTNIGILSQSHYDLYFGPIIECDLVECWLGLRMKGSWTNTNSKKSSSGSRVSFDSIVGSKSKNLNPHSFPINEIWLYKIDDSISRSIGTRINVGLGNGSKLSKNTGVNIDS